MWKQCTKACTTVLCWDPENGALLEGGKGNTYGRFLGDVCVPLSLHFGATHGLKSNINVGFVDRFYTMGTKCGDFASSLRNYVFIRFCPLFFCAYNTFDKSVRSLRGRAPGKHRTSDNVPGQTEIESFTKSKRRFVDPRRAQRYGSKWKGANVKQRHFVIRTKRLCHECTSRSRRIIVRTPTHLLRTKRFT